MKDVSNREKKEPLPVIPMSPDSEVGCTADLQQPGQEEVGFCKGGLFLFTGELAEGTGFISKDLGIKSVTVLHQVKE